LSFIPNISRLRVPFPGAFVSGFDRPLNSRFFRRKYMCVSVCRSGVCYIQYTVFETFEMFADTRVHNDGRQVPPVAWVSTGARRSVDTSQGKDSQRAYSVSEVQPPVAGVHGGCNLQRRVAGSMRSTIGGEDSGSRKCGSTPPNYWR
jgi:hypothetical protein